MKSTGARQVDIVAHSLGVTVAREWMFQDNAYNMVRSLVAIEGPNHGIIDCSPDPLNFFELPADGGFIPTSAICDEYGKEDTRFSPCSTRPVNLLARPGILCSAIFFGHRRRAAILSIYRHRMDSFPRCRTRTALAHRTISPTARCWPALLTRTS